MMDIFYRYLVTQNETSLGQQARGQQPQQQQHEQPHPRPQHQQQQQPYPQQQQQEQQLLEQEHYSQRRRGVQFCKLREKYKACMYMGGRKFVGNSFPDADDAARQYDDMAYKLKGANARLNFELSAERKAELDVTTFDQLMDSFRRAGMQGRRSSRFRGVSRANQLRWKSKIKVGSDHKEVHLGYFTDEVLAALTYDAAARQMRRPETKLNFPNGPPPGYDDAAITAAVNGALVRAGVPPVATAAVGTAAAVGAPVEAGAAANVAAATTSPPPSCFTAGAPASHQQQQPKRQRTGSIGGGVADHTTETLRTAALHPAATAGGSGGSGSWEPSGQPRLPQHQQHSSHQQAPCDIASGAGRSEEGGAAGGATRAFGGVGNAGDVGDGSSSGCDGSSGRRCSQPLSSANDLEGDVMELIWRVQDVLGRMPGLSLRERYGAGMALLRLQAGGKQQCIRMACTQLWSAAKAGDTDMIREILGEVARAAAG